MTQAAVEVRNIVSRSGFANPLTLSVLVSAETYVKVYADEVLLVQGDDYTITGIGDPDGVEIEIIGAEDVNNYVGYVTFTAVYDPPLDQQGDLSAGGVLGRSFESALDQQNRLIQAVEGKLERAIKVAIDTDGDQVITPEANYAIGFDDDGNLALLPIDQASQAVTATAVGFTPVGTISASNVQAAIAELDATLTSYTVAVTAEIAAYAQPLDGDLTAIAALAPSNDDFIQRKAGAWTNRTPAQAKVDLGVPNAGVFSNLSIGRSVGAGALTVSVKTIAGGDPSATDPVLFTFRDPTAANGNPVLRTLTAALSLTISSGSTMGFSSGTPGRLWLVVFDDAGTLRLGLVNALSSKSIMALHNNMLTSSTAEGGAGAADSAHVIYTGTTVTTKPLLVLARLDWSAGLATAGTWSIVPTTIGLALPGTPRPGDVLQVQRNDTGALATGTTVIPYDDTIPQITEGIEFMTQAITCRATMNVVRVTAELQGSDSVSGTLAAAIFQDATANALAVTSFKTASGADAAFLFVGYFGIIGTVSSSTFRVRAGCNNAGTFTFNGTGGARRYGGVYSSYIQVEEIMA